MFSSEILILMLSLIFFHLNYWISHQQKQVITEMNYEQKFEF